VTDRDKQSNYLTNYLESSSSGRWSWRPYLYVLLGFVALVLLGGLLLWLV
jgi:hypothetical protein